MRGGLHGCQAQATVMTKIAHFRPILFIRYPPRKGPKAAPNFAPPTTCAHLSKRKYSKRVRWICSKTDERVTSKVEYSLAILWN